MSDGTMTDTADGNVATGDLRIAFAALVEALHDNSLDAIVEVVGAPAEYNRGKAAMREWFMNRLRYFLATISAPGTPVVPPLSNAEAVVPASPSPPVGGGIDTSTSKSQSHARQDAGAKASAEEGYDISQTIDGVWREPTAENFYRACCDCGLIHREEYRVHEGKVQYRVWRDVEETAKERERTGKCAIDMSEPDAGTWEEVKERLGLTDSIEPPPPAAHGTEPSKPEAVEPSPPMRKLMKLYGVATPKELAARLIEHSKTIEATFGAYHSLTPEPK